MFEKDGSSPKELLHLFYVLVCELEAWRTTKGDLLLNEQSPFFY